MNPESEMETVRTCQDCGAVMPASHTGTLCAKCVLGLAAEPPATQFGEAEGDVIGPYTLRQNIGEGGFGVVWMAEQTKPISRMVALKVVKAGMDTKQVLARFEAEQQALALLDHSNIAKVLDAGATETGRPYFVMELVKGIPITQFCQEQRLATKARLELFRDVCSVINHAHQKGIIHRDLKPSNVMVTLHGDNPVAKVIDFGIAKATQQKLTDKTLFTRFEQLLGTPVYMSPEQAALSGLDIDTRSDIYSLGVLLYELLAGKPPFDPKTLLSKGYEEMRRIICEDEPPKPSTKLTETQSSADNKFVNVSPSALKGELDWIIMKAIDKDRARRYETANAFASDIGRYLENEPVLAAAPSAVYKFRKFARRNKAALGVATAMVALLVGGIIATSWQAVRATVERDKAEEAREEAEAISAFLVEMFEIVRPDEEKDGREVKVADVLDNAVKRLETDLLDQPARQAKLQRAIGMNYFLLGLSREAIPLQEQVLEFHLKHSGREHFETLAAMNDLSVSYVDAGRDKEALKMLEKVWELNRKVLGPENPLTLAAMNNLGSYYHADPGRREDALKMREKVWEMRRKVSGPEHPNTLAAMSNLAQSYRDAGRREDALKMLEKIWELNQKVNGPEHPNTLAALNNLALSYRDAGREGEALKMLKKVWELNQKVSGPEHPNTLAAMHNLALSYHDAGRTEDALKLLEKVSDLQRKVSGPEHPHTLTAIGFLAESYHDAGREEEALELREKVWDLRRKVSGPDHPNTLTAMGFLAMSYHDGGREEEALKLREKVLELRLKVNGSEHPRTLKAVNNLESSYKTCENPDRRIDGYKRLVELIPEKTEFHSKLGRHLYEAKRYDESIDPLSTVLTRNPYGDGSLDSRVRLVRALQALKRADDADQVKAELKYIPRPLEESSPKVVATLISPGAEWRWLHPTDGVDPEVNVSQFHTAFSKLGFDDSSWNLGKDSKGITGGFGYGDKWFTGVVIGKPEKGKRHSAYFRCRFTTTRAHSHIELRCQRDDGLIVYLDGKEVARDNVSTEPDVYQLYALQATSSNEQQTYCIPLRGRVESGEHVLAISLHNGNDNSSDLRMGSVSLVAVEETSEAVQERRWQETAAAFDADELREAGQYAVIQMRFADALVQFESLVEKEQFSNGGDLSGLGALLFFLGREERFQAMLKTLFRRADLESLDDHIIKLISLVPNDNDRKLLLDDWRRESLRLATLLTDRSYLAHWFALARGKAEYRSGNWTAAREWLSKAPARAEFGYRNKGFLGQVHGFLAMARFRAGQIEEAKAELALGLKRFHGKPSFRDLWYDELLAYLALQEAWDMIEGADAKNETLEVWKELRRNATNLE